MIAGLIDYHYDNVDAIAAEKKATKDLATAESKRLRDVTKATIKGDTIEEKAEFFKGKTMKTINGD